ncbi:cytochrome P450 [Phascolomyces articulosus]|uniref:Cytochrome P450 n=1 Tax=Phascolomyces articulosus TaxID=60185 RepID=A0AAD5P7X2_9FUNG|nr:cytochrome P450 [Phascolomyces articulosus]
MYTIISGYFTSIVIETKQKKIVSIVAAIFTLYGIYNISSSTILFGKKKELPDGVKEIPTPSGALPYFGHIFQVPSELPALKFDEWHKKYGPLIRVKMGVKSWLIIGDRYHANNLLKVHGSMTSGRAYHLFLMEYNSMNQKGAVFTNPDKRWKKSRTVAQGVLGAKAIEKEMSRIESVSAQTTQLILENTRQHGHVDITKYMQLNCLNVIMYTCLGISAKALEDPLFKSVIHSMETTVKLGGARQDIHSFLPAFTKLFNLLIPNNEKAMHGFVYGFRNPLYRQMIDKALQSDTPCYAKIMYQIKDDIGLDEDDLLVLMADLINAGSDPTALTIAWSFVILVHHPNRLPHYDEREQFPYMLSVQKECIRYKSAKHLAVPREATEDFVYQGYFIPKGTVISPNTYTLCQDPAFYDRPDEFVPDRYIDDLSTFSVLVNANIEKRDLYTFGWGRRMCPGYHLVEVEFFNIWVQIFATTVIEPPLDTNGNPKYPDLDGYHDVGIIVAPRDKYLRFIERTDRIVI